jgi:hypothetical protein
MMMAGNSDLDVLAAQAKLQGKNQCENQGAVHEVANQQGPHFTMPKDMALTTAFCAASKDECVGTSQIGANFKKGIV